VNHSPAGQGSEHDEKDHGADESGQQAADGESPSVDGEAHQAGQKAAQERTHDADHDVPQQAHALAADDLARGKARNRADNDENHYSHWRLDLYSSLAAMVGTGGCDSSEGRDGSFISTR
jgi:hypothetical protein